MHINPGFIYNISTFWDVNDNLSTMLILNCNVIMEPQVQYMLSEKNKTLFVIEDFKFYFQKLLRNDIERWACCKRLCTNLFLFIRFFKKIKFEL
jgi:hypothetical protein